jgi:glycosyltransferase involved in cell wall biosynthesis
LLVESLLYTKNQNLTLLIAGDGPNKEKIKAQIKEFGLEKRVLLVGEIADPTPLYFESKAFILPSSTEGSPISIVEAMAAGLPILASNIGGIPDLLETSPFKFIFDVSINAKELAAVIDNCFNKKQSFFDQARLENRRISDQWSIQNVAAQYKSFYSLCASKN